MSRPHVIWLYRDDKGEFRWRRVAGNNRNVNSAGEGFTRKQAALKNMHTANADFEDCVIRDTTGQAAPKSRAAATDLTREPLR